MFYALAKSVYENEALTMGEGIGKIGKNEMEMIGPGDSEIHKRMPKEIEQGLLDSFEIYKKKHEIIMETDIKTH